MVAALALPVVGLATGRVVGDLYKHGREGDPMGIAGALIGLMVYLIALASSYSHLRNYYSQFESRAVKASWAMALAIEMSTFYMSAAYVLYGSPWAFWGSLLGAFVVFWGNFDSMLRGKLDNDRASREVERPEQAGERQAPERLDVRPPVREAVLNEPSPSLSVSVPSPTPPLTIPSPPPSPSPSPSPPPSMNGGHEQTQAHILDLIRMGLDKQEIADRLQLTEAAVNFHLTRLARRGLVRLEGGQVLPNQ